MIPFRFRLERLLDLRVQKEREEARGVAEAREAVVRADRVVNELVEAEGALRAQIHAALEDGPMAGQVHNLHVVLEQLRRQRAAADADRRQAEDALEDSLDRFRAALQEREVLDKLKARKRKVWSQVQKQEEQKHLDEARRGRDDGARVRAQGGDRP